MNLSACMIAEALVGSLVFATGPQIESWDGRLSLRGVRLLPASMTAEDGDFVYVTDSSNLPEVRPGAVVAVAIDNSKDDHVVRVWAQGNQQSSILAVRCACADDLLGLVDDVFIKHEKWDERMVSAAIGRVGMEVIVSLGADELPNPVALLDPSYYLIAWAGEFEKSYSGTVWDDMLEQGRPSPAWYRFEGDSVKRRVLEPSSEPVVVHPQHEHGHAHLFAKVVVGGKLFATLAQVDVNCPFTPGQIALLCHVRDRIQQVAVAQLGGTPRADPMEHCLRLVLGGDRIQESALRYHLANLGWNSFEGSRVAIVPVPSWMEDKSTIALKTQLAKTLPLSPVITYDLDIIILVCPSESLGVHVSDALETYGTYAVESNRLDSPLMIQAAYMQCRDAISLRDGGRFAYDRVLRCDELFEEWLYNRLNPGDDLWAWCDRGILLTARSGPRGYEMVHDLKTVLLHGGNLTRASKVLHMHRNTLQYRMETLTKSLDISLEDIDTDESLKLILSCSLALSGVIPSLETPFAE